MKLTVGPLPATVYWRRRSMVLGGVLLVLVLLWASCSAAKPDKKSPASTAAPAATVSSDQSLLVPTVDGSGQPSGTAAATGTPLEPPVAAATPCTDTEILVTPVAAKTTTPRGAPLDLSLKVKNISARSCNRDLGAEAQELYVQLDAVKVWSSDACSPRHESSVKTLNPGDEQAFFVTWRGKSTAAGCDDGQPVPAAGKYQLFGRLGTRISDPVVLTLT